MSRSERLHVQLRDEDDAGSGIERGQRAPAHVMLAIHYGEREVGAELLQNGCCCCCVERLSRFGVIGRRQDGHAFRRRSQDGLEQFGIDAIELSHEITDIVGRAKVQHHADISAFGDEID